MAALGFIISLAGLGITLELLVISIKLGKIADKLDTANKIRFLANADSQEVKE